MQVRWLCSDPVLLCTVGCGRPLLCSFKPLPVCRWSAPAKQQRQQRRCLRCTARSKDVGTLLRDCKPRVQGHKISEVSAMTRYVVNLSLLRLLLCRLNLLTSSAPSFASLSKAMQHQLSTSKNGIESDLRSFLLHAALQTRAGGINEAYRKGAEFLQSRGFTGLEEINRILDIAMNPNSLYRTFRSRKRSTTSVVRLGPLLMQLSSTPNLLQQLHCSRSCHRQGRF